jgi:hypothetical protein
MHLLAEEGNIVLHTQLPAAQKKQQLLHNTIHSTISTLL